MYPYTKFRRNRVYYTCCQQHLCIQYTSICTNEAIILFLHTFVHVHMPAKPDLLYLVIIRENEPTKICLQVPKTTPTAECTLGYSELYNLISLTYRCLQNYKSETGLEQAVLLFEPFWSILLFSFKSLESGIRPKKLL